VSEIHDSAEAKAVALLYNAAIADDRDAFCKENAIDAKALLMLRHRHAQAYITFLESIVREAAAEVKSW
jgi:hypothetical protein